MIYFLMVALAFFSEKKTLKDFVKELEAESIAEMADDHWRTDCVSSGKFRPYDGENQSLKEIFSAVDEVTPTKFDWNEYNWPVVADEKFFNEMQHYKEFERRLHSSR